MWFVWLCACILLISGAWASSLLFNTRMVLVKANEAFLKVNQVGASHQKIAAQDRLPLWNIA
jgi:hypothetical protein